MMKELETFPKHWVIVYEGPRAVIGRRTGPAGGARYELKPAFEYIYRAGINDRGQISHSRYVLPLEMLPSLDRVEVRADRVLELDSLAPSEVLVLRDLIETAEKVRIELRDKQRVEAAKRSGIILPTNTP